VVVRDLPKVKAWVRFPLPAQNGPRNLHRDQGEGAGSIPVFRLKPSKIVAGPRLKCRFDSHCP